MQECESKSALLDPQGLQGLRRWSVAVGAALWVSSISGCSGTAEPAESGGATGVAGSMPTAGSASSGAPGASGAPSAGATSTGGNGGGNVGGAGGNVGGGTAGDAGSSTGGSAAGFGSGGASGGSAGSAGSGAGGSGPMKDVAPCATNMISKCTGSPLACHFGGSPGNYLVTVELGGAQSGDTAVEAEFFRRMLTQTTLAGETKRFSFVTNVREYEGEPLRPDQDGSSKGIAGLDVYFRGTTPRAVSICYETMQKPLMLWLEGDSTVTDQENLDYSGWGQHLPQHFVSPIAVANYADSGESSGSVLASSKLWPVIRTHMKAGDWVMVQVGHNDKTTTEAAFRSNLLKMITDTKNAGGHMILVTPISRVGYTLAAEHVNSVGANLPKVIRDLGKSENVPVIDLTVTTWNWLQTIKWQDYFALGMDHTHTNPKGADIVSGFVRDAVRAQIPELAKYLR